MKNDVIINWRISFISLIFSSILLVVNGIYFQEIRSTIVCLLLFIISAGMTSHYILEEL